ncbi:MAG: M20 family metallopeptidase [Alphaproteobacteria bacterium]|nr:M20 family metallopeptidase [Alphaproteobacteria bacterium]
MTDPPRPSPIAPSALRTLEALVAFDTSPGGPDHTACIDWLGNRLRALGFELEVHGAAPGRPLLVAHRNARGLSGHVVFYGHYDVTSPGRPERWRFPPWQLSRAEGRLWGRGVADNKGPLACRLSALEHLDATPAITWLIQGEEECGSDVARAILPGLMPRLEASLWLDETGYHDHEDGTLRLLGRTLGPDGESRPPDRALGSLLDDLRDLAARWGVGVRHECRGLNKSAVQGGCPFNEHLPVGARYLALGVNDSAGHIHGRDESVPEWTFALHAAELEVVFRWADRADRQDKVP